MRTIVVTTNPSQHTGDQLSTLLTVRIDKDDLSSPPPSPPPAPLAHLAANCVESEATNFHLPRLAAMNYFVKRLGQRPGERAVSTAFDTISICQIAPTSSGTEPVE